MRPSSWLNIGCIIALSAAVLLFFNHQTWWGLLLVAVGGVLGIMAGRAMAAEPPRRSRLEDE